MECRLCGATAEPFNLSDGAYEECSSCGFLQKTLSRLPTPDDELKRYRMHHNDPDDPGYLSWARAFVESALKPWLKAGMNALDFGSGPTPIMQRLLEGSGLNVRSYDPFFSPDLSWEAESWDALIVHEVAEHIAWPGRILDRLAARMSPGAILALRTRFPPASRERLASWWYRMDSTHVGFFPARSLKQWAARHGLTAVYEDGVDSITFSGTGRER